MNKYPKVSIVIFAKNEEEMLPLCLKSVYSQIYPRNKLEVIFVDDMSSDKTAEIAKSYSVKYFKRDSKGDRDANKLFGFQKTTGEIVTYLDADIHVRGKTWLKKMVKPLVDDKEITASFTKYYSDEHSSNIERYLNLDPLQRDAIYQFFSPSPESVIVNKNSDYSICEFSINKIPPQGVCFHRRESVKKHFAKNRFLELDILVDLVQSGHSKFAYVPSAGMYHHHADSLSHLLKKRKRNVTGVYLVENEKRLYRWFDTRGVKGIVKIIVWILIVHLIFPLTILGLYKSIKNKTCVGFFEPIVGLLTTDVILYSFLKEQRGRNLILKW
jgi:glycosyltransferase involved in cell wall biosynthesis